MRGVQTCACRTPYSFKGHAMLSTLCVGVGVGACMCLCRRVCVCVCRCCGSLAFMFIVFVECARGWRECARERRRDADRVRERACEQEKAREAPSMPENESVHSMWHLHVCTKFPETDAITHCHTHKHTRSTHTSPCTEREREHVRVYLARADLWADTHTRTHTLTHSRTPTRTHEEFEQHLNGERNNSWNENYRWIDSFAHLVCVRIHWPKLSCLV